MDVRLPREPIPLSSIDVRALAEVSDAKDVFLSVYLPTASEDDERLNRYFIDARLEAIRGAVSGDLEDALEATLAEVGDVLFHDRPARRDFQAEAYADPESLFA